MSPDALLTAVAVGLAAGWIARRAWQGLRRRRRTGCGGGCGCGAAIPGNRPPR